MKTILNFENFFLNNNFFILTKQSLTVQNGLLQGNTLKSHFLPKDAHSLAAMLNLSCCTILSLSLSLSLVGRLSLSLCRCPLFLFQFWFYWRPVCFVYMDYIYMFWNLLGFWFDGVGGYWVWWNRSWLFLWWFEVELGGDYYVFVNMHERERENNW